MNIRHLVCREIAFRKAGFALGLISVSVAIAGLVGSVTLLEAHDLRTEQILTERERATSEEMTRMEDDYRKIMRDLGYNIMILPAAQKLSALRALGHPDTDMPEDYVERLGRGRIETLNHLLPVLQRRVTWPEHNLDIILSGTPGQVPVYHKRNFLTADGTAYRDPILKPIPPGRLILGHNVARDLGLRPGDRTTLMGETFVVDRVNRAEGSTDDIAVWCDLRWAQKQLGLEGKINLILALECVCAAEALGQITAEVQGILPDVQVLEFSSRVVVRARARVRAEETHRTAIEAERAHRANVAAAQRRFASVLVPVTMAGSALWMFFLFLGNVRDRKMEIGILRAVGVREHTILSLFMAKAVVTGLLGAVLGYAAGLTLAAAWSGILPCSPDFTRLMRPNLLAAALLIAPAMCALAGWWPAVRAARQDPAVVLRED